MNLETIYIYDYGKVALSPATSPFGEFIHSFFLGLGVFFLLVMCVKVIIRMRDIESLQVFR